MPQWRQVTIGMPGGANVLVAITFASEIQQ
jgi:hypothetical protein